MNYILVISGSRDWDQPEKIETILKAWHDTLGTDLLVRLGGANGADKMAEAYCKELGIEYEVWPANWSKHKKAAGPIRNTEMIKGADALFAFRKNFSPGTTHAIKYAEEQGLYVEYIDVK